jgi:hypothetical protein
MILIGAFVFLILFFSFSFWRNRRLRRTFSGMTWNELAQALQPLNMEGIDLIANRHLRPEEITVIATDAEADFEMIGRIDGLDKMCDNANIMIELAAFAQDWSEEAVTTTELMRRDALSLKRAAVSCGISQWTGYGKKRVAAYVAEAASAYYLMRRRLLTLYEHTHSGRYPILIEAFTHNSTMNSVV